MKLDVSRLVSVYKARCFVSCSECPAKCSAWPGSELRPTIGWITCALKPSVTQDKVADKITKEVVSRCYNILWGSIDVSLSRHITYHRVSTGVCYKWILFISLLSYLISKCKPQEEERSGWVDLCRCSVNVFQHLSDYHKSWSQRTVVFLKMEAVSLAFISSKAQCKEVLGHVHESVWWSHAPVSVKVYRATRSVSEKPVSKLKLEISSSLLHREPWGLYLKANTCHNSLELFSLLLGEL